MHDIRFTSEKIEKRIKLLKGLVYSRRERLSPFKYSEYHRAVPEGAEIIKDDSDWPEIGYGTYWGRWKSNFILQLRFSLSEDFAGEGEAALYLPLGVAGDFSHPEGLVYIDGTALASCDRHHQEIMLPDNYLDSVEHTITIYGWTGLGGFPEEDPDSRLLMRDCSAVRINTKLRAFLVTAETALEASRNIGENDPARGLLLNTLDEAFKTLDTREPLAGHVHESLDAAAVVLHDGIAAAGPPLNVKVAAAGHAHLDVAWLWTLEQTRGKAARTFHNVIHLMKQFPGFIFSQSQPQLYEYVKADFPELFETIKERVAQGLWEPMGGMWVEADCNITGAESLARQFILGRKFFSENFGKDSDSPVLWLPDVFGYAGNLPQLAKLAGIDYFFTIKIGWNQYNRLPYDSFWWSGLDGTKILTHFSSTPWLGAWFGNKTVSTYNANATVPEVVGTWNNFQQKESQQELLMVFGQGDGGGGPTREMLENINEMKTFPSLPAVANTRVGDFFRNMEENCGESLPVWNGELYLELHRGTYTTQGRNKMANRRSEFLLHDTEFLAVGASVLGDDYSYPSKMIERAWKLVCLNQFHDIIPGSSIEEVYRDSMEQYAEIKRICEEVSAGALEVLAGYYRGDVLVINTTGFERDDLVFIPRAAKDPVSMIDSSGKAVAIQSVKGGLLAAPGIISASSVSTFFYRDGEPEVSADTELRIGMDFIENRFIRLALDSRGDIVRIYDRINHREVLSDGGVADELQIFEDRPLEWDAWDIEIYYEDRMWHEEDKEVLIVESGPLRATLEIRGRILSSEYVKYISLDYNSPRITFRMKIDWSETHILLKTAFPVDVFAPSATYEIQWGNVERPTHRNTSWDWARFESCAQKWVDLSEGDYGVSLLNDGKYGHDIRGNVMRLSLLRSPTLPDPQADQGLHEFSYALLPHAGRWGNKTVKEAYLFNNYQVVTEGKTLGNSRTLPELTGKSLFSLNRDNLVIETVKKAEDGDGVVIRLYESRRMRGNAVLTASFPVLDAWKTNLLEEDGEALETGAGTISFSFRPYEIITIRLVPG